MLITFMICSFLGTFTGLVATVIMWVCNMLYAKRFDLYNTIGFGGGFVLTIFQHWIR